MTFQQKVAFALCIITGAVTLGVGLLTFLGFVGVQQMAQRSGAPMPVGNIILMVVPIGYFFVAALIYGAASFFIRSRNRVVLTIAMLAGLIHIAIHIMGLSRSLSPILFDSGAGAARDNFVNIVVTLVGVFMVILLGTLLFFLAHTMKRPIH